MTFMEMQRRGLLQDRCEATLLFPMISHKQCHIKDRCCHFASTMEKVYALRNLSQAQFSLRMPRHNTGRGPCIGGNFRVLQFAVSSATNVSTLGVLEESVQATVSTSMNSLHMANNSMASFPPPFRSSIEEEDMEHFFLFSDNESLNNDDEQATQDFLQNFRSVEDLNDHLFRTWWEKVSHNNAESIKGSINEGHGMSDSAIFGNSTNGFLASCEVENLVAQGSSGQQDFSYDLKTEELGELFLDSEDGISVLRVISKLENVHEQLRFRILIPKDTMKSMPPPPNDLISPPESVPDFNIEVRLVELQNQRHVDACIDWLLRDSPDAIALVCKHGAGGSLGLIQLSAHQRCVLIKVSQPIAALGQSVSLKFRALLFEREIMKVGLNIQKDALALNYFLGMTTNSCVRVSQFVGTKRRKSLLTLCRELFQWEWSEKKKISCSNWASKELSLEQVLKDCPFLGIFS